jgi:hypothetical protein
MSDLIISAIAAVFGSGIVGFLIRGLMSREIKRHDEFVKNASDQIGQLNLSFALMKKDIETISQSTQLLREMHQEYYKMKSSLEAAWRIIDEQKDWTLKLRERTHLLSNWISILRTKCEQSGMKFSDSDAWMFKTEG